MQASWFTGATAAAAFHTGAVSMCFYRLPIRTYIKSQDNETPCLESQAMHEAQSKHVKSYKAVPQEIERCFIF
jgi:hypothetical protein